MPVLARLGNVHPNIVPYQAFTVRDGHIMLAVGNDAQLAQLFEMIDQPGLATDPRFSTNKARVGQRETLVNMLEAALIERERGELLNHFEKRGVPAGPINGIDQVFADPPVLIAACNWNWRPKATKAVIYPACARRSANRMPSSP